MNGPALDPAREQYVSLATFRRDGREVGTPVWIAQSGACCYIFSEGRAGKVKRLRNNDRVRLAACDMRGKVSGGWAEGSARIVSDPATVARAYHALRAKYGWMMKLGDLLSRLSGRYAKRAIIEIELD